MPPVSRAIIIASVVVFLLQASGGGLGVDTLVDLIKEHRKLARSNPET